VKTIFSLEILLATIYEQTVKTWGRFDVLKTIIVGSCMSVQGILEKSLPDGRISVRVGDRIFTGRPVVATS
jgi:hypothetical protein